MDELLRNVAQASKELLDLLMSARIESIADVVFGGSEDNSRKAARERALVEAKNKVLATSAKVVDMMRLEVPGISNEDGKTLMIQRLRPFFDEFGIGEYIANV